jgi:hypothetical protein
MVASAIAQGKEYYVMWQYPFVIGTYSKQNCQSYDSDVSHHLAQYLLQFCSV